MTTTAVLGITPEQHAVRRTKVTASELAAVMGLDPYKALLLMGEEGWTVEKP